MPPFVLLLSKSRSFFSKFGTSLFFVSFRTWSHNLSISIHVKTICILKHKELEVLDFVEAVFVLGLDFVWSTLPLYILLDFVAYILKATM